MSPLLLLFAWVAPTQAATDEVAFRTIAFGSSRQIKDGGAVVMRDAKALAVYRRRMGTDDHAEPKIDWAREEIVALHAAGVGYGASSIQVVKVRKKADGGLEVEAALDRGSRPATPTPGVTPLLRKEGIYTLIAVPPSRGAITLRVVDPPASSGDRPGTPDSR